MDEVSKDLNLRKKQNDLFVICPVCGQSILYERAGERRPHFADIDEKHCRTYCSECGTGLRIDKTKIKK
jgi:competence CoiA-like predicted nuclease